jgi:uncharacterized protein with HEPN domain
VRPDLDADRSFNLSLVRLLEVLGEAARRIPDAVRATIPGIPWSEIVGLRNRLIHDYDVDFDIVWHVVSQDPPSLIAELEKHVPPSLPGT